MILAGAWLLIFGYGIAYAGVFKLAHTGQQVTCSLRDAFTGQCKAAGSGNTSLTAAPAPAQQASSLPPLTNVQSL